MAVPHRHDQGTARQSTKGVRLPKNKMNNNTAVKPLRRGVTLVPPPHTSPSLTGFSPGSGTHVFPSRALAVRAALRPACRRSARAITAPDGIRLSWRKRGLDGDGRPRTARRHAPRAWHGGHCRRRWGGHHRGLCRGGRVSTGLCRGFPLRPLSLVSTAAGGAESGDTNSATAFVWAGWSASTRYDVF